MLRRPHVTIFYGWWIVLAGAALSALVGGSIFYGLGAFFAPIQTQFKWSYAVVSWAFSLQVLAGGIGVVFAGWLFDRVGPRALLTLGVTLAGLGFLVLSQVQTPPGLYAAFIIMGIGTSGATFLVLNSIVTLWFHRKLGRSLALLQTGYGVGGLAAPGFVALILAVGWRPASVFIAAAVLAFGLPLTFILRHSPTTRGLLPAGMTPDGVCEDQPSVRSMTRPDTARAAGLQTAAVLKTSAFWIILLVFVLSSATSYAVFAHQIRAMITFGVTTATAGAAAGAASVIGLLGRFGFGWLAGSFSSRYLLAAALGLQAMGILALSQIQPRAAIIVPVYVILFGIGQGGIFLLSPIIQHEYFGTRSFGTVQGLLLGPSMVVSAAAPLLVGVFVDSYSTYRPTFVLSGLVGFCMAGLVLFSRIPAQVSLRTAVAMAGAPAAPE